MYFCQAAVTELPEGLKPLEHCSVYHIVQCAPCARYECGIRRPHFPVPMEATNGRHSNDSVSGSGHLASSNNNGPGRTRPVKRRRPSRSRYP